MFPMSQDWQSALRYFPLKHGEKYPADKGWQQTATNDLKQIAEWRDRLNRDLGIKCGAESNLLVLDEDGPGALAKLEQIVGKPLPRTHIVHTSIDPANGFQKRQHYFQHPKAKTALRNFVGFLDGLDVRTEGGLVVAADSKHIPGHQYESQDELSPVELPLEFVHAIEKLQEEKKATGKPDAVGISEITKGARNDSLFRSACKWRAQNFAVEQIKALLAIENRKCKPPLSDSEVSTIADSAAKYTTEEARKQTAKRTLFLKIKKATDLDSTPQQWLWYQVIRRGVLNLFVGLPDIGKTFICILIIVYLTRGKKFPFSKVPVERGKALIICKEDSESMWGDRLGAGGADLEMVDFVTSVGITEDGSTEPWYLDQPEHLEILKKLLLDNSEYKLCLVDPISSFVPHSNLNDQAAVRLVLDPFTKIAQETNVAMLLTAHTTKALIDSVLKAASGSIQIMASVQNAFYFAEDPQKEGQRLMLQARNKSGVGNTGFRFHIEGRYPDGYVRNEYEPEKDPGIGVAVIDGQSHVNANELLRRALEKDAPKVAKCAEFLVDFLANGPVHRDKCLDALRTLGYSDSVRDDACARLKIRRPRKAPFMWSLPSEEDRQKSPAELVAEDMGLLTDEEKKELTTFDFGANSNE
jgi:bifunctional DNA primase/polymerase-like protein/AAA domain-containing protein/primase-like protein